MEVQVSTGPSTEMIIKNIFCQTDWYMSLENNPWYWCDGGYDDPLIEFFYYFYDIHRGE